MLNRKPVAASLPPELITALIGHKRRAERRCRRAKRRGKISAPPHQEGPLKLAKQCKARAPRLTVRAPKLQNSEQEGHPPLTSWRNPRAHKYQPRPKCQLIRLFRAVRVLVGLLWMCLLASAAVIPALAMTPVGNTIHHLRNSTAFVNYGAAEVQDAQREQLAAMRLTSYDPDALARLFEHGINQHLPDGIAHRVDTSRYVTDKETGLVIDRPPGVIDA
jgi:hypothetical protein